MASATCVAQFRYTFDEEPSYVGAAPACCRVGAREGPAAGTPELWFPTRAKAFAAVSRRNCNVSVHVHSVSRAPLTKSAPTPRQECRVVVPSHDGGSAACGEDDGAGDQSQPSTGAEMMAAVAMVRSRPRWAAAGWAEC